jgi:hypothetical protein
MAVTNDDLTIKITAETVEAIKSVKNLGDVFGGLGGQILKANAAVDLAIKGFEAIKYGIQKVVEPFQEAVHASIEYQSTLGKLRNTLKITGEFSEDALKSFEQFAEAMERTTTLTQEQAYTMLSLAKAVGVTDEQAKQMVQTAKNLSAVTGRDVNESFHALLSSLKGNSRELMVLDPTLKNLSTSAFMSGAAIDQLAKKYDGFAESAGKSFKGIVDRAKNFKEEISRNVGDVLMVAFDMKSTEEFKLAFYKNVLETIERIKPNLIEFAEVLRDIKRELVGGLVAAAKSFADVITGLYRAFSVLNFKVVAASVGALTIALGALLVAINADAVIKFITNISTLITTLRAFAAAAWATVAPVALLALKFAAVGAAIIAVVAAVDFLTANGIKILTGSLLWLGSKLDLVIGKFLNLIGMVKEGSKLIQASWKLDDKASEAFSKIGMGDTTKDVIDKINEMRKAYLGAGKEAGHVAEETKKISGAFKDRKVVDPIAIEAYTKALNEINQKTKEINLEAARDGMSQVEIIEEQLRVQEELIDAKIKEIEISKQYTSEQKKNLTAALNEQRGAIQDKAEADKLKAPGEDYEKLSKSGDQMIQGITQAFQTGTTGVIAGYLSVADKFVDFLQGVVDFLPNFLNKIANLFNSITDLPMKLVSSLEKVFQSITGFIANALPNMLRALPQIMRMVVQFLAEGIPQAFNALFDAVPDLIVELIDAIPEFVQGIVTSYIDNMPRIVISFVNKIIPALPRIAVGLFKTLYIELPRAILKGIIDGLKNIRDAVSGSLSPKIDIKRQIEDITKLTGSSADIFGVKDLTEGLADSAQRQAEEYGQSIKDGMQWAITMLINAWRWIYDKIIAPIGKFFQDVFNGIAAFFKPIFDAFAVAFRSAVDLLRPVGDMFKWVAEKLEAIFGPFIDAIRQLMSWNPASGITGGGTGGFFQQAANQVSSWFSTGGPVYASEGMLMTPRGTDTIPAMLSPGEFVMSAGAVKSIGIDNLKRLNSGAQVGGNQVINNEFNIKIESKGNVDEAFVRTKLMSVIKEELRRSSLDGERLLSSGGVR